MPPAEALVVGERRVAMKMRAFFVNSGILGHASVARLIHRVLEAHPEIEATHLDLEGHLTTRERVVRRLICWGPQTPGGVISGLTLARWRHEFHAGVLAAGRIREAERRHGAADVLHFHTQATALASVSRMHRTPSIVSIDITQHLASAEVSPGIARWQYAACATQDRAVFRAARAVIVTSQWAADDLIRDLPDCASRVHVMPYPVPLAGFDRFWIDERHDRALRGEPTRILFMGGDFPRKGGHHLLEAWRVANFGAGATLQLVTDWPLDARTLPDGVQLQRGIRAYTPEWFSCWRQADIFVMPTTGEAFGMVFQEAAAAGLASIGTRLNAIPELVVHGKTGLLVPVGDVHAIAASLRQLVADPDLRQTLGTAGRERIERNYAPNAYSDHLVEILNRAMADAGSRIV